MTSVIETDVLIVGAGPAGCTAAMFLAKKKIASVLVDKEKFPRDKICGDALSGKAVEVLNKLDSGLVTELQHHSEFLGSYGVTFVAPNGKTLRVPFQTKKEKQTAPGFTSKRLNFDQWLLNKTQQYNEIDLHIETEIRYYSRAENSIIAQAKNGQTFKAKLVVACDGAYSSFTKDVAGIATEPGHNCFGLRAYYKNVGGLDADNFIELHFLNEFLPGYFWVFPLPNGYANVGVGMRADKMTANKINLKKTFENILATNPVIKKRFSNAEKAGDIKLFGLPLGSKKRELSGANFMLCGDAAMLIDPFTGEGIGNAMFSGLYAANQAERCLQQNDFTAACMKQYDKELYKRLWGELLLSYRMQQLVNFPWLFNFVVNKANKNTVLRETISCMFEDLDMRARLKSPLFYLKLLFSSQ